MQVIEIMGALCIMIACIFIYEVALTGNIEMAFHAFKSSYHLCTYYYTLCDIFTTYNYKVLFKTNYFVLLDDILECI